MLNTWRIVGLMSGTSLDGLDIAVCQFVENINAANHWSFNIVAATTIPYDDSFKKELMSAYHSSAVDFKKMDYQFGKWCGEMVHNFLKTNNLTVDLIASHGHTVFHQPEAGISVQLGSGAALAAFTGIDTVCDFRALDVAKYGQGAPLVPVGDQLLFSEYEFCLNLGGIANISFVSNGKRIAYDVCPCNLPLNFLAQNIGCEYDANGLMAKRGKLIISLFDTLNTLDYYQKKYPKSLGFEWFGDVFLPYISNNQFSIEDRLNTVCEHIAFQISKATNEFSPGKLLITGGGAFNGFLIEKIKSKSVHKIIVPNKNIVMFKEALIFAFLGLLRYLGKNNTLKSVTGSNSDSCGGALYLGNRENY